MRKRIVCFAVFALVFTTVSAQRLIPMNRFGSGWDHTMVSLVNKPNGYIYRMRKDVQSTDLPRVSGVEGLELFIAEPIDMGWMAFYRKSAGSATYDFKVVLYNKDKQPLKTIDLCEISGNHYCEVQDVRWDADNHYLLFNMACPGYSDSVDGKCSKLYCYSVNGGSMVWETDYLVSNDIFILDHKYVYCSYGFTGEKKFIYMLDKLTGKVYSKIPMVYSVQYMELKQQNGRNMLYAVDYNPDAVELCKVVLWIEGYCAGKPLSFLDHHIRCGNSVVGVTDLQMLIDGVPDKALTAEDRPALNAIKQLNKDAVKAVNASVSAGTSLFEGMENPYGVAHMDTAQISLADKVAILSRLPENTLEQMEIKRMQWEDLMRSPRVDCLRRACDIYTYAFYYTVHHNDVLRKKYDFSDEEETILEPEVPYTKTVVRALQEIDAMEKLEKGEPLPTYYRQLSAQFKTDVANCAASHRFFHWCVEFPEVFAYDGGFDVMCGNPPWDKIKVEDKKWFEQQGRSDIVNAGTAAQRKRAISNLPKTDPMLFAAYLEAQRDAEAMSRFVRLSGRFRYSATGDIDYYPLFAENCMSCSKDAWGLVLPTGIAISDNCKTFFSKLVEENRLISLYDFENREALFDIHRMFKFCLLTAGSAQSKPREVTAGFYLTRLDHLLDPSRIYKLKSDDFALLNPNTKTCPIFRTSKDAMLTSKIYHKYGIILKEESNINPWHIEFGSMFHMSNDSYLFKIYQQLISEGAEQKGNVFITTNGVEYVPLYEGKMIWQYNHHFGTWPIDTDIRPNAIPSPTSDEWSDPNSCIFPWYWIPLENVESSFRKEDAEGNTVWEWKHNWQLGIRKVSNATNERTCILSLMPRNVGVGESIHYVNPSQSALHSALLLGMLNSLPFDYIVRQKMGGSNMSNYIIAQLPVLSPEEIHSSGYERDIVERVACLCWFNHDLDGWMDELRSDCSDEYNLPNEPLIWNENQRAVWLAELDAIFAHLYGLTTDELRYILDPEDICGPGCINETFRVLKDNEIRQYGEYRTKRLVLEAWKRFGYDN